MDCAILKSNTKRVVMTEVNIFAGICGFNVVVKAKDKGGYTAELAIESECPNWSKVNEILEKEDISVMKELFKDKNSGALNSRILEVAYSTIPHVSCPVISGVLKTLEVSVGLALPQDATISFNKTSE